MSATPRQPYYVSFSTDPIPTTVDHTQSNPGPTGGAADRAGHTSVHLSPHGGPEFVPRTGPARADGLVPFYFQSINVRFTLTDFIVAISSDFAEGSCAFNATRRHEFESHLYRPIRIFHRFRDTLIERLNNVIVPTETNPRWVRPVEVEGVREALEDQVKAAVHEVYQNLRLALRADRDSEDDAAHYRLVHGQCTAREWSTGR